MSAEDLPENKGERLTWLQDHVRTFKPQLIIIDLMFHFAAVTDANNYQQVRGAIADLQDALRSIKFQGHTVTSYHNRKMVSADDPFDNLLGSTVIRGSFATIALVHHDHKRKWYTIQTEQTQREPEFGEISETVLERDPVTGELRLGQTVSELEFNLKKADTVRNEDRVLEYITQHPDVSRKQIEEALSMSSKTVIPILRELNPCLKIEGRGVANDPKRYTMQLPVEVVVQ